MSAADYDKRNPLSANDVEIFSSKPRASQQLLKDVEAMIGTEEIIHTDGSCLMQHNKKKRRAGYAVNFGAGDARNVSEPIEGSDHTNQIGELTAVVVALERSSRGKRITIYSDSHYVIKGLVGLNGDGPWHKKWLTNGWRNAKGKPVEYRELWERAIAAGAQRSFTLLYSKAHSGIVGNEEADAMARAGARVAQAMNPTMAMLTDLASKLDKEIKACDRSLKRAKTYK